MFGACFPFFFACPASKSSIPPRMEGIKLPFPIWFQQTICKRKETGKGKETKARVIGVFGVFRLSFLSFPFDAVVCDCCALLAPDAAYIHLSTASSFPCRHLFNLIQFNRPYPPMSKSPGPFSVHPPLHMTTPLPYNCPLPYRPTLRNTHARTHAN